ncbi:hypothetical protein ES705_21973 [subsurface metagenome]
MPKGKYGAEAQEKAYQLFKIQQLPFDMVIKKMREEYPTFSKGTLTKWRKVLAWDDRYGNFCKDLAAINDKELVKKIKPIVYAIESIREEVYDKLIDCLKKKDIVTEKNFGYVLAAFVRMGELEYKMKGGRQSLPPVKQVVNVILMALEKNPVVGPIIAANKSQIEDAIFEEIGS